MHIELRLSNGKSSTDSQHEKRGTEQGKGQE